MPSVSPPATFALCGHGDGGDGEGEDVIAVGMTLPDGSAITVNWRNRRVGTVGLWSSPERAAVMHDAQLVWFPAQAPAAR
jgi:hypothetical protein